MKLENRDYFLVSKLTEADYARVRLIMADNGATLPDPERNNHWRTFHALVFTTSIIRTRMMLHGGRSNMYFLGREVKLPRADHGSPDGRESEYREALVEIRDKIDSLLE